MKPITSSVAAVVFILIAYACPVHGTTIHVPAEQPTVQAGIGAAADGDLVLVSPGTYVENISFLGKAIAVRSEAGAEGTIIDGNQAGSAVSLNGIETGEAVIDGFTVRNGNAYEGGGICCMNSSGVTITNCEIIENEAQDGGGFYCKSSSPTITDCTITENIAYDGGGIYSDSSFPTIMNCGISANSAGDYGGGICCMASSATITGCTITKNSVDFSGGGIYCLFSDPTIADCMIANNDASEGGGISFTMGSPATITNSTIEGNVAGGVLWGGGGIYCHRSRPAITNCTISRNSTFKYGGGIFSDFLSHPIITNCILWENSIDGISGSEIYIGTHTFPSSVTVGYSDVQGGESAAFVESGCTLTWLDGNIDLDPLFVGGGDYHLTSGSPCIDSGTDAGIYTDIDGDERPQGAGFDMGSDEYRPFTLDLDASYGGGELSLAFSIGTPEPAMWANYLILTYPGVQIVPLWTVPLPVIDPPVDIPIALPFPSIVRVGIWSGLFTDVGIQALELAWVDTG